MPLILPPGVSRSREAGTQVLACKVPGCTAEFPLDRTGAFEEHVKHCADRNSDVMEEIVARSRDSYFNHPADEEMYAHFRRGRT